MLLRRRRDTLNRACGAIAAIGLAMLSAPAHAACDADAPLLTDFDFTPTAVNVTSGSADVTCTMSFDDSPAGVDEASCTFVSPTFAQSRGCTAETPSSGNRQSGTFTCTVTLPRYANAGTWSANSVTATDRVGRVRTVSSFELQAQGWPTALDVTSDPDLVAPEIQSFGFTPQSIDVSAGSQDVSCTVGVTDAKAGVASVTCSFTSPGEIQAQVCIAFTQSSGTRNNGTFGCTLTVPRYAEGGTWVASVFISDRADNLALFDDAMLAGMSFPTDLSVTSVSDVLAPSLDGFSLSPTAIDVSSSDATVTCSMQVSDSPAGVSTAGCELGIFAGLDFIKRDCTAIAPTGGTRNNGTFACDVVVPAFSPGGTWQVQKVELVDAAGNTVDLTTGDLLGLGFPTDVDVTCGGSGGEGETDLFWRDKQTLVWDAIPDAILYNVYRGEIGGLDDLNADGLPDSGYGSCQNARDLNPTDTEFAEPDVPASGDGYFHLVGYDSLTNGDLGLGTTSGGQARIPAVVCP